MDRLERLAGPIGTSAIVVTHDDNILLRLLRIDEVRSRLCGLRGLRARQQEHKPLRRMAVPGRHSG